LHDGHNVLLFRSKEQLLRQLLWALEPQHAPQVAAIARAGAELANGFTPARMVDGMVDALAAGVQRPLTTDDLGRVAVHVSSLPPRCHVGAYLTLIDGLKASLRVVQAPLWQAEILIVTLWDLFCAAGAHVRDPYAPGDAPKASELLSHLLASRARLAPHARPLVVVAIDFADTPALLTQDARIDFYFKRSRVDRARQASMHYHRTVLPLYYPVRASMHAALRPGRPMAARAVHARALDSQWQQRPIDVAYLFSRTLLKQPGLKLPGLKRPGLQQRDERSAHAAHARPQLGLRHASAKAFDQTRAVQRSPRTQPVISADATSQAQPRPRALQSVALRQPASTNAPRVLIHCPQNAGCTAFACATRSRTQLPAG
jgi:hypothetical protein